MSKPEPIPQDGPEPSTARILTLGATIPMPSREEAERIQAEKGMVKVKWNTIQDMQKLGIEVESMGVITTNIGYGLATIDSLSKTMALMEAAMASPDVKNKKLYVGPMVNLAKAIALLIATTSKIRERSSLPDNAEPKKNRSFQPGQIIDIAGAQKAPKPG